MMPKPNVESVKQSPLNARRWCVNLSCGHETWITSKRKPTRKHVPCAKGCGRG